MEEGEFEPMFLECESKLRRKKIALFGSYGWGDGERVRTWEDTCRADGAVLARDSVISNETPDGGWQKYLLSQVPYADTSVGRR